MAEPSARDQSNGISTIEREFMSDMLLPSGQTVGEWLGPQLDEREMPSLLPPGEGE